MRTFAKWTSLAVLGLLALLPLWHFSGGLSAGGMNTGLLVLTILWFITAPCWMGRPLN